MEDTPGFRFYPTEEELISFYLKHKLQATREPEIDRVIPVVNIYDYNPWDLPQMAGEECRSDDPQVQEWFFFIPKQEREVTGGRPNRLTTTGYWKATGSPGYVYSSSSCDDKHKIIGVKRTMVFYRGRAPTRSGSSKTQWKMNEYMAIDHHHHQPSSSTTNPAPSQKGDYTVCRVYIKSNGLRAFDRRPGAPPITNRRAHQVDQPCLSDHQAQPTVEIVRCSSSESSSSSGDHRLQLNNNNNNNNHNNNNNNNNNSNTDYDNDLLDQGTNNNNEQQETIIPGMEIDEHEPLWEWDSLMMNWNL